MLALAIISIIVSLVSAAAAVVSLLLSWFVYNRTSKSHEIETKNTTTRDTLRRALEAVEGYSSQLREADQGYANEVVNIDNLGDAPPLGAIQAPLSKLLRKIDRIIDLYNEASNYFLYEKDKDILKNVNDIGEIGNRIQSLMSEIANEMIVDPSKEGSSLNTPVSEVQYLQVSALMENTQAFMELFSLLLRERHVHIHNSLEELKASENSLPT